MARGQRKAYQKAYRLAHREETRAQKKTYYLGHREEIKARRKVYDLAHQEEINARGRAYYFAHRIEIRARKKAYRLIHRREIKANRKIYRLAHRKEINSRKMGRKYGISQVDFDRFLAAQDGACAICGKKDWNCKGPQIDHDHVTKIVRGLLCFNCNTAMGLLHEDRTILKAMDDYLVKFR